MGTRVSRDTLWHSRHGGVLLAGDGTRQSDRALRRGVARLPCDEVRDRGLHRSRLALACAQAGELDRAKAEGTQAFVIAKQTGSVAATRELRRLGAVLRSA
jgi:hypothetical protein